MRVTPEQAVAIMKRRTDALIPELQAAQAQTMKRAKDRAFNLTKRQFYSLDELAEMGHPYSRWRPRPPMDPAVINLQSGNLSRRWGVRAVTRSGNRMRAELRNTAPYWNSLRGKEAQISRPIWKRIKRELLPEMKSNNAAAIRRALRKR
jgi:hypothetical protein